MKPESGKWRNFERLVAAIHKVSDQGAEVFWDESINGRQFDVIIRFKKGLYDYLTVVECKDYGRPVPVDKVDAFVTKARDARANHGVMASSAGFQSGAQEVARRHGITLIHVTDSTEIDVSVFGAEWGPEVDALQVDSIELRYSDGERRQLPPDRNAMDYYVNHISLRKGAKAITLAELITAGVQHFAGREVGACEQQTIPCPTGYVVHAPDDGEFPSKPIQSIHLSISMTTAKTLTGPVKFDPCLLVPDVKVHNLSTGEVQTISRHNLPLGGNTTFKEVEFYEQLQLPNYYYCDRISGDSVNLYLIESFQLGQLFQAALTVPSHAASFYVPVTDATILKRLRGRLARIKDRQD